MNGLMARMTVSDMVSRSVVYDGSKDLYEIIKELNVRIQVAFG